MGAGRQRWWRDHLGPYVLLGGDGPSSYFAEWSHRFAGTYYMLIPSLESEGLFSWSPRFSLRPWRAEDGDPRDAYYSLGYPKWVRRILKNPAHDIMEEIMHSFQRLQPPLFSPLEQWPDFEPFVHGDEQHPHKFLSVTETREWSHPSGGAIRITATGLRRCPCGYEIQAEAWAWRSPLLK